MEKTETPSGQHEQQPQQFHFWRILIVCNLIVAFCAISAWIVSTYFYE